MKQLGLKDIDEIALDSAYLMMWVLASGGGSVKEGKDSMMVENSLLSLILLLKRIAAI